MLASPERLPLAVYGTLRTGFGNHALLAGRIDRKAPGVVDGYELAVDRIPFARRAPGSRLVVEVMWPTASHYDRVLADVDHLEGYSSEGEHRDNLYVRISVAVTTDQGYNVGAWLYEIGPLARSFLSLDLPAIPTGDYADAEP